MSCFICERIKMINLSEVLHLLYTAGIACDMQIQKQGIEELLAEKRERLLQIAARKEVEELLAVLQETDTRDAGLQEKTLEKEEIKAASAKLETYLLNSIAVENDIEKIEFQRAVRGYEHPAARVVMDTQRPPADLARPFELRYIAFEQFKVAFGAGIA